MTNQKTNQKVIAINESNIRQNNIHKGLGVKICSVSHSKQIDKATVKQVEFAYS